ncbi:serine/threonine-protein phosphatase CPPED1 isoform X1 [Erythrolamprus reginae]|uniref:serine/threonine-protein phosphatase CPPED1 isoform X1 n=2 Tax=Erythrolamprus reginae TaxID=121349 RepID=UPI00396C4F21
MAQKVQNELLKARDRTLSVFREEAERDWKGPFYFIQGADPQFGLMKAYSIGDCSSGGDEWGAELKLTRQAVEAINCLNPRPKFLVLCGDLIHGMPGTEWREAQIRDLRNVLKDLSSDIPLVFVSGNHDLGNTPTPETVSDYCQQWGDDYFSFWVGGVFFLVLNSQLYFDASQCSELKAAQDAWLERQLAVAQKKQCRHAVVFQHIPFFVNEPEEDHNYFNLEKAVRHDLMEKFCRAGIKTVFSGHLHKNAGGTYKDLNMVISSAIGCQLGEDTHGVRMVAVTAEKIIHRYYSLSELSNHQNVEKEFMALIKPN